MEEFPEVITKQCPECHRPISAIKMPDQKVTLTCDKCGNRWTPPQ